MQPDFEEVLKFIKEWKTFNEIQNHFGASYTPLYHLLKWGVKGKFIVRKEITIEESNNLGVVKLGKKYIYKSIEV